MALKTIHKDYSDPLVQKSLYRVLRENVLCSMSTVSTGHRAYVNTAYFCHSPQLELFFLSDPESFHCRNLAQNPSMAIAVFRSDQTWGHPDRGVQLFGICREARGSVAERAGRLYSSRFPPFSKLLSGTSAVARKQARLLLSYRFYRFVANRVKILDEREFGAGVFVLTNVPRSAQPVRER